MADWSTPTLSSLYTDFLSYMKDRDVDIAKQFDGTTSSNVPTGAIKWNSTSNRWNKWDGSAWQELTTSYGFNSVTLPNGTANGVAYLNGSKVLTSGSALTFDGSNFATSGNIDAGSGKNISLNSSSSGQTTKLSWKYTGTEYAWIERVNATGDMAFGVQSSEQMRLTSTGLGIGTGALYGGKLTIIPSANPTSASDATNQLAIGEASKNSAYKMLLGYINIGGGYSGSIQSIAGGTASNLLLNNDGGNVIVGGNLGLGVTPSAWYSGIKALEINGKGNSIYGIGTEVDVTANAYYPGGAAFLYGANGYATKYVQITGQHQWFTAPSGTAGSAISFTQAMTLDASGNLNLGVNGTALQWSAAGNNCYIAGSSGVMSFATGTSGYTERMRIDSSGNLLVGGTFGGATTLRLAVKGSDSTASNSAVYVENSAGTEIFRVKNNGAFYTGTAAASPYNNTTASASNIYVDSVGYLYRSTSSLKYKTDVQDATHGLAELLTLRPVTYKGKTDGNLVFGGLIAEEVDAAGLTEFVQYAEDGTPDALAYGNMVSLCIKAIQELKAELDATKAEVAALKVQ